MKAICVHITVWEALMWESWRPVSPDCFWKGHWSLGLHDYCWITKCPVFCSWLEGRHFYFLWASNAPSEILPPLGSWVGGSLPLSKHQHPFLHPLRTITPQTLGANNLLLHHNCCSWGGREMVPRRGYLSATLSFLWDSVKWVSGVVGQWLPPTPYPILAVNQREPVTHS